MNDQEWNRAIGLFRESTKAWSEHWMQQPLPARRAPRRPVWRLAGAAAAIVAATLLVLLPEPRARAVEQPFVAIPFVAPPAPYERVAVTRVVLPVTALVWAGFDMPAGDLSDVVEADVLLGQDGRPHAVRLLGRSVHP